MPDVPVITPAGEAAVAVLREVRDRLFAAEGHSEDMLVNAAKGVLKVAESTGEGLVDTADRDHDAVVALARGITDEAFATIEALLRGESAPAS